MKYFLKGGNVLPSEYFGAASSSYHPVSSHTSLSAGNLAQSFGELAGSHDGGLSTGPNLGVYQSGGRRRRSRSRRNNKKNCGTGKRRSNRRNSKRACGDPKACGSQKKKTRRRRRR